MILFGVTGGIGMGKSTVGAMLQRRGVQVVDTDALSHQLTRPGQPALAEIIARFGSGVARPDGSLNRKELAQLVFNDANVRRDLEAILHPKIRALWEGEVARWKSEGQTVGAVVIPLLFETAAEKSFAAVICAACSEATQRQRLAERGWTPDQIAARISAQMPIDQKIARSNYIVWTDTSFRAIEGQLDRIIDTGGKRQKTPACA